MTDEETALAAEQAQQDPPPPAVEPGAVVVHAGTLTVGTVTAVHAAGAFKGADGAAVASRVVELDTGDTFVWRDDETLDDPCFVVLHEPEARYFLSSRKLLRAFVQSAAHLARTAGVNERTAAGLAASALEVQARSLRAALQKPEEPAQAGDS